MTKERKSWATKDVAIVQELLALMTLSAAECAALASLREEAKSAAPAVVEEFYGRLLAHEATREFITDPKRLGGTLAAWFVELFCGKYDEIYARSRLSIGMVHVRIGLPVRYPLAMMDIISRHGERIAAGRGETAIAAFRKVLAIDIATFNQAYENNQLHHLIDLVGSERLARRILYGELASRK